MLATNEEKWFKKGRKVEAAGIIFHRLGFQTYTKELVTADRCALFMVDARVKELYAEIFDEGVVVDGKPCFTKKETIRYFNNNFMNSFSTCVFKR